MANIKVVNINEADKQEEATAIEDTKEIEEEAKPEEILNEVVEQTNEEIKKK